MPIKFVLNNLGHFEWECQLVVFSLTLFSINGVAKNVNNISLS